MEWYVKWSLRLQAGAMPENMRLQVKFLKKKEIQKQERHFKASGLNQLKEKLKEKKKS